MTFVGMASNSINFQFLVYYISSTSKKSVYSSIVQDKNLLTGFSIILVSFQGDRTVIANRGANALLTLDDIDFDASSIALNLYRLTLNSNRTEVCSIAV